MPIISSLESLSPKETLEVSMSWLSAGARQALADEGILASIARMSPPDRENFLSHHRATAHFETGELLTGFTSEELFFPRPNALGERTPRRYRHRKSS